MYFYILSSERTDEQETKSKPVHVTVCCVKTDEQKKKTKASALNEKVIN